MVDRTPGDWQLGKGFYVSRIIAVSSDPTSVVAELYYGGREVPEVHANGRLMAAAPDLLAACEVALALHDEPCWADHHGYCQAHNLGPIEDCWVGKLRAAIAKAKGETNV